MKKRLSCYLIKLPVFIISRMNYSNASPTRSSSEQLTRGLRMAARMGSLPQTVLKPSVQEPQGRAVLQETRGVAMFLEAPHSRETLLRKRPAPAEPLAATFSEFALWCPNSPSRKGKLWVLDCRAELTLPWSKAINTTPRGHSLGSAALSSGKPCRVGHAKEVPAVDLGDLHPLSMPQFPHLCNWDIN